MPSTHRLTSTAAVILSLAAVTAPTATARSDCAPADNQPPPTVYSRPDKSMIPVATPNEPCMTGEASTQQAVVRVRTPPSGFDWGDAGIGAAGGIALAMLGLGGALIISQRPRRTRESKAQPN
jgi:hypothetical protein